MIKIRSKLSLFFLLLILLTNKVFATTPELIFSKHFGGSADDFGYAMAVDSKGNTYITGYTGSDDFPTTADAYSPDPNGECDVFIVKFDPLGNLVWSTYFGGSGIDYAKAIAVDQADNIYITGGTDSSDLPLTSGGYNGLGDGFIAVFDSEGDLIQCDYFGEDGVDNGRGIAVGYNGDICIVGYSSGDALVVKFDSEGYLIWFVSFGGEESDIAYGVAIDYYGNIYVIGETGSPEDEFPVTDGAFDETFNGFVDVFIAKFDPIGNLLGCTYLGGPYSETGFAIDVYQEGVYVTGTAFQGFPYTHYLSGGAQNSIFISKLDLALTYLEWSTILGGRRSDYGFGIKVDSKGYVWVIGHTFSDNFPTTANAFDRDYNGGVDVVIARINPSGENLIDSTYLGGVELDSGRAIALDEVDEIVHVHIAGYTESPQFLASFGVYGASNNGGTDIFTAKILFPSIANLIISTTTGGTTNPAPGTHTYDIGMLAQIEAIPDNSYRFSEWIGDIPSGLENDNPITITMDSNKSITANFIRQYTLTIVRGTGGTTNPSPGSYDYDTGTEVSITATPNSGYEFSGWSGDAIGTTNPITITVDADKSITANFEEKKGPCFIATATYNSRYHPHVKILKDFRDKYFLPTKFGRRLVDLYYKYSPSAADLIAKHKVLKIAVRINLLTFVVFSYSMVHFGPIITAIMLVFIFILPIASILLYWRKLRRVEAKDPKAWLPDSEKDSRAK